DRNVDPAADREVSSQAGTDGPELEGGTGGHAVRPPADGAGNLTSRHRDHGVLPEPEVGAACGALQQRGIRMIPHQSIGHRGGETIHRAARRYPVSLEANPATILHRGPAAWPEDIDHETGTKRNRSPALKRAGGSAIGSKRRMSVRPIKFHPPGLSTA